MIEKERPIVRLENNAESAELAPLRRVFNPDQIDRDLTFSLKVETSQEGSGTTDVFWLSLRGGVEGKVFIPRDFPKGFALFEPGLPGDSVGWFEARHAPALAEAGYTVLSLRHRGLRTDTAKAAKYVNCPERIQRGASGATILGGEGTYTLTEIIEEPAIALNSLRQDQLPQRIALIGHSAGSLYHTYTVANQTVEPEVLKRIKSLVSLGGYVDLESRGPRFGDINDYYAWCRTLMNMGEPADNIEKLKRIFETTSAQQIPSHIMVTLVQSPDDEYVSFEGAEKFQELLSRGLLVVDKTQSRKEGEEIHNFGNLRPQTLLRLMNMDYPKSKHRVVVTNLLPKPERKL